MTTTSCPNCHGPVEVKDYGVLSDANGIHPQRKPFALPDTMEGIQREWVHYIGGKPNCYHPEMLERALHRLFQGCAGCGRESLLKRQDIEYALNAALSHAFLDGNVMERRAQAVEAFWKALKAGDT